MHHLSILHYARYLLRNYGKGFLMCLAEEVDDKSSADDESHTHKNGRRDVAIEQEIIDNDRDDYPDTGQKRIGDAQVNMLGRAERRADAQKRKGAIRKGSTSAQRCDAACTTCFISVLVVTVPTPPGTGVIASASVSAASKSTSPVSEPSSVTLMPTSMMTWPSER